MLAITDACITMPTISSYTCCFVCFPHPLTRLWLTHFKIASYAPGNRLPWICDQLSEERAPVTKGEGLSDKSKGHKANQPEPCLSKGASNIDRETDGSYFSTLSSPSTLQEYPRAQAPGAGNSRLRWEDEGVPRSKDLL